MKGKWNGVECLGQKKKLLCCPLPTDRKMRKNRVGFFFFFFFFMSDLGEEFAKICIQWLKKALVYMRFDCIPPEFFPFSNFKKNIGKLNSFTVRKKNKKTTNKKNRPTDPIFRFWSGEGNITIFFCPYPLAMLFNALIGIPVWKLDGGRGPRLPQVHKS